MRARRCPKARPVAVMCPVEPDMVQSLKAKLRRMPRGTDKSPLRKTGRTHFGRWVVMERLCDEDGKPCSKPSSQFKSMDCIPEGAPLMPISLLGE